MDELKGAPGAGFWLGSSAGRALGAGGSFAFVNAAALEKPLFSIPIVLYNRDALPPFTFVCAVLAPVINTAP